MSIDLHRVSSHIMELYLQPRGNHLLTRPHHLQMLQYRQITIHKPVDTIAHTRVLFTRQPSAGHRSADALSETGFAEFVDCYMRLISMYLREVADDRIG